MAGGSHYTNFLHGVTIRGVPILQLHPGRVFWVNNSGVLVEGGVGGSDGNPGTYIRPFATIDKGINSCLANRGDIIAVMPGHAETIAAATEIVWDVAGIAVVGLGVGSLRPTLTFSATGSNILVSGANSSISNILHLSTITDCVSAYTATGTPTDFTIEGCEFRDTSATLGFINCFTGVATANATDGFAFLNNHIWGLDATALTTAVEILEVSDRMRLNHNWIVMPAVNDTPALMTTVAFSCLDLEVAYNVVWRPSTSTTGGALVSGTEVHTGMMHHNQVHHLDNSAGIIIELGSTLGFHENYSMVTAAADKSALINPVAV